MASNGVCRVAKGAVNLDRPALAEARGAAGISRCGPRMSKAAYLEEIGVCMCRMPCRRSATRWPR